MNHAMRIQARAINRAGELLKEVEAGKNRFDRRDGGGPSNRKEAAEEAGMSERQRKTAIRRAGELIETIEPATGTTKAEGDHRFSRTDAAREAGMSERQRKTAIRVANFSEANPDEFERTG